MMALLDKLEREHSLTLGEYQALIEARTPALAAELARRAVAVRERVYGRDVYIRGLIEISNYCKNDCLYCGIRRSNANCARYRLTPEEILACCEEGYALGFRTFVLQGGEDAWYTDERLCDLIAHIKDRYPTAPLPYPWASAAARVIKSFSMPAPTAICCATKRPPRPTMPPFIRRN